MQTITVDLRKEPEIADLALDMHPGDGIRLCGTIKSIDDQSLVITVEEAEPYDHEKEADEKEGEGNEGSGDEEDGDDLRNPQGDKVTPAGNSYGGNDLAGSEQAVQ